LGPVTWVLISEIFPTRIRGRAMSIATMTLWLATWAVAQTFPMMLTSWGGVWTFWFYTAMAILTVVFVATSIPETKGKTLEDIEHYWMNRTHPPALTPQP
jgi:SP family arabinose:H+ symporter-like MFS transporter